MDQSHSNRRRTRIVDAPAQARVVWGITVVPMVVLVIAALVMWYLSSSLFDEAQASNAELPSLGLLTMLQFFFVAVTGVVAVLAAFQYSHRVVGPAYRLTKALQQLRGGDVTFRVQLRKGDELTEIADELNLLLAQMQAGKGPDLGGASQPGVSQPGVSQSEQGLQQPESQPAHAEGADVD